jgi:hypothetical protein
MDPSDMAHRLALTRWALKSELTSLYPSVLVHPAAPLCLEQASANFQLAIAKMLDRLFSSRSHPCADIVQRASEIRLRQPFAPLGRQLSTHWRSSCERRSAPSRARMGGCLATIG